MSYTYLILLAAAYTLGSLPFSLWIGRTFFNTDVREHGSGNAGATNTWRTLGWKAGLPVLLLDITKGYGATYLPYLFAGLASNPEMLIRMRIFCGLLAALGHIYPVFAGFRGGKAVATLLGVILGLMPIAAAGSLGVFIITMLIFRYVSLASVLAAILLPFFVSVFVQQVDLALVLLSGLTGGLVLLTHLKNLGRLFRGEEARVNLRRKKH